MFTQRMLIIPYDSHCHEKPLQLSFTHMKRVDCNVCSADPVSVPLPPLYPCPGSSSLSLTSWVFLSPPVTAHCTVLYCTALYCTALTVLFFCPRLSLAHISCPPLRSLTWSGHSDGGGGETGLEIKSFYQVRVPSNHLLTHFY